MSSVIIIPFSLILVFAANSFSKRTLRIGLCALLFAITISSSALMLTVNKAAWTVYKPNPDWRTFASDVREHVPTTVFTSCPVAALAYYLRDSNVKLVQMPPSNQLNKNDIRLYILSNVMRRGGAPGSEGFYIAVNLFWRGDMIKLLSGAHMDDYFKLEKEEDYLGLRTFKYTIP